MAFDPSGQNQRFMSEINVTPFVDVMLVLLVIFMVTAPMMMQGIEVKVPKVEARAMGQEQDHVIISVTAKGEIFLEEFPVGLKDLGFKVRRVLEVRRTSEVFLRADRSIPYGEVARIMSEIRSAGVTNLGLVTDSEQVKPPEKGE
jgi:biopolymer transport protein TolR